MKKTIVFVLLFIGFSLSLNAQTKKEQRQIKQANVFVTSLVENLSDVTEEEKTKFFDFKLKQIKELEKVNTEYEKGTDEHKVKFQAVLKGFQKEVKDEFGTKRGAEIIRASLTHLKN